MVREDSHCDSYCSSGGWHLYQRDGDWFRPAVTSAPERGSFGLSVGVDQGRFAIGNPGYHQPETGLFDNALAVIDANVVRPAFVVDETVPYGDPYGAEPVNTGYFRHVDLSGDVLAHESCCSTDHRLHIRAVGSRVRGALARRHRPGRHVAAGGRPRRPGGAVRAPVLRQRSAAEATRGGS